MTSLPLFFLEFCYNKHSVQRKLIDANHVIIISDAVHILFQISKLVLRNLWIFPTRALDFFKTCIGQQINQRTGTVDAARINNYRNKHIYRIKFINKNVNFNSGNVGTMPIYKI